MHSSVYRVTHKMTNSMELPNVEAEDFLCDESFQRYCPGEDKTDVQHWEAWIRQHPDKLPVVNAAKRLYEVLSLGQGNRLEQLAALKDAVARRYTVHRTGIELRGNCPHCACTGDKIPGRCAY